ncbi:MAG: S41 family peptidase [Bacteroidota bacterium]
MRLFSLIALFFAFSAYSQKSSQICETLTKINKIVVEQHFNPKPVDDSLSVFVFDSFIEKLDEGRTIFIKPVYDKLSKNRLLLDNHILENNCAFFDDFLLEYKLGLERKKRILEKLKSVPFNYNSKDSIRFTNKKLPFDILEIELEKVLNKRIRYEILKEISTMSSNLDSLKKNFISIEKTIKNRIFETELCKINNLLTTKDGLEPIVRDQFLTNFCTYFDPHSDYLSADAKSTLLSFLSTENLSLGLNIELNEDEEIIIVDIIPGGPASKNDKIQKDDIIVKLSNKKGNEYWVSCTSLNKIGEMFFSDSNKEIDLTIRKKNGTLVEVSLEKELMKAVNNTVFSFVAENETRVGYIKIPSFYSDNDLKNIKGCADDLSKEIIKLQNENIEGLVIDLQDNGGGSMEEAVKLVSMFIDYGPISVFLDNKNTQSITKDMNHGMVYKGPIVILINGRSASASEFFSATMQDYSRAFILGSTSFGKATMQTIIPLDKDSDKDFIKLTGGKFYRVTGDSSQIKGVVPNISLPIVFNEVIERENKYSTAIKYDIITTKAKFSKFPSTENSKIITASQERSKTNVRFKEIEKINIEINNAFNQPKKNMLLVLDQVFKNVQKNRIIWNKAKELIEKPTSCKIYNTSYEKEKIQFDVLEQEINTFKIKDVTCNPYLEEAIKIIKDYNNFTKQ